MKKILFVGDYDCGYNWDLMLITIKDNGIEKRYLNKFNKKICNEEKIDLIVHCHNGNISTGPFEESDIQYIEELCDNQKHFTF